LALIGVVLVGMTGFGVFLPIFPFLGLAVGAGPTAITIAMGAYSLGQLISAPIWGRVSDRIGRKPVLIFGLLGAVASYVMLAHAENVEEMFGARLFSGLMAGNVGAAFAAAADLADNKTRARNMGLLGAAFAFGFIAGPVLAAFVIGHEPDKAAFVRVCYTAGGFAALAALGAFVLFKETLPPEARRDPSLPRIRRWTLLTTRPVITRLILVTFLMITAQALLETSYAFWVQRVFGWGPRQVGYTLGGLGVAVALIQGGGAGRAAHMIGERRMLLIGLLMFALGMGWAAVVHDYLGFVGAAFALTFGGGLATPALQSLIAGQAGEGERGSVMGLSQAASALGRVTGPAFAGALFEHVGVGAPFATSSALLFAAFALGLSFRREALVIHTPDA
jgi:DHA1 family tetracycline resistance protein-like MFS transporter